MMEVDDHNSNLSSTVKLPGPGEDATPFMIRCYVKRVGNSRNFRPLGEFDESIQQRPFFDEFKLFVWRTTNLREIATILFIRDSNYFNSESGSSKNSSNLFAFRVIRFNPNKGYYVEKEVHHDISRLSNSQLASIKKNMQKSVLGCFDEEPNIEQAEYGRNENAYKHSASNLFNTIYQDCLSTLSQHTNETAAKVTLESMGWQDGDILDCIVYDSSQLLAQRDRKRDRYSRRSPPRQYLGALQRYDREDHRDRRSGSRHSRRSTESKNRRSASPTRGEQY